MDKQCCDYYEEGLRKINNFIQLANIRAGRTDMYDGKPFNYCPWCGAKQDKEALDETMS